MRTNIIKALIARLAAFEDELLGPPFSLDRIVLENDAYEPKTKPYLSQFSIPLQNEVAAVGSNGDTLRRGILRLVINCPADEGVEGPMKLADRLIGEQADSPIFYRGQRLQNNGTVVNIFDTRISTNNNDGAWYRLSLSVEWYSHSS